MKNKRPRKTIGDAKYYHSTSFEILLHIMREVRHFSRIFLLLFLPVGEQMINLKNTITPIWVATWSDLENLLLPDSTVVHSQPGEEKLLQGNLVTTIPTLHMQWRIAFAQAWWKQRLGESVVYHKLVDNSLC